MTEQTGNLTSDSDGGMVLVCGDYQLNSFGSIRASDFTTPSSRVLKEHIVDLPAALGARHIDIARQLRPVEFNYKVGVEGDRPRHIALNPAGPRKYDWQKDAQGRDLPVTDDLLRAHLAGARTIGTELR